MTLTRATLDEVARELEATFNPDDAAQYRPRYNGAPSDVLWLLIADDDADRPRIVPASWGLPTRTRPAINIKAETLRRGAFKSRRRSVAIVDGFYEWQGEKRARRPYWFHRESSLLLLAAVDTRLDASTRAPLAFAIITTTPGPDVAPFHDRQPAIIEPRQLHTWLSASVDEKRLALLAPAPAGTLDARPVSPRVNKVAHDDATCILPYPESKPEASSQPRQLTLLDDKR